MNEPSSYPNSKFKGILLAIMILSVLVYFGNNDYAPNYSVLNSSPLGSSYFFDSVRALDFSSNSRITVSPLYLHTINQVNNTLVIIVGSDRQYLPSEIAAYEKFVNDGGTLLLFEDFGPARKISNVFGVGYLPGVIKEMNPSLYTKSPDRPLIFESFFSSQIGIQLPPLQLNRAASPVDIVGFIAKTTLPILLAGVQGSVFVDTNDNNVVESTDIQGPVPFGIMKTYGDGLFVTFGDSSFPLNVNWKAVVNIADQKVETANGFFVSLILYFLKTQLNIAHVIFDETHLGFDFTSLTGIISWVLGSFIALIYSRTTLLLVIGGLILLLIRMRGKFVISQLSRHRGNQKKEQMVSHPSRVERIISEQYILYNVLQEGIIHVAIQDLIQKMIGLKKSDEFLNSLTKRYGDITLITSFDKLFKIYQEITTYLENSFQKWI